MNNFSAGLLVGSNQRSPRACHFDLLIDVSGYARVSDAMVWLVSVPTLNPSNNSLLLELSFSSGQLVGS